MGCSGAAVAQGSAQSEYFVPSTAASDPRCGAPAETPAGVRVVPGITD